MRFVYFWFLNRDNPYDPSSGEKGQDNVPPATDPMCREQNALQGRMTQPTNLPMKDVNRHYLTCMDSRVGYAAISAPGGDMGQFILGLGKLFKSDAVSNVAIVIVIFISWFLFKCLL